MAEEVGQAFVSILPSLKGFSSRLKAELAGELRGIDPVVGQAGQRAGGTFGDRMREGIRSRLSGIGAMLKAGLIAGTAAVVAGLGAMTVFGLKSAATLEQTQIGIEALLGSAEDAKTFIGELQQFAAKTPFEFQGVADASRRILAFGGAVGIARDEVIPTLGVIGDLVSVLGGGEQEIASVVRALGQISSKGKVSQEELLQLAEALPGFNANAAIAAQLGLSVGESMEAITRGEVDATTGINALLEGMRQFPGAAGAMEKQSQTLLGVFSTFKDTIGIALTNAFQPIIPAIKDSLAELTPVLGSAIDALAPSLGTFLTTLMPLIGELATALGPVLTPVLEILSDLLREATAGSLAPLGEAIGQVLTALAPLAPVIGQVLGTLLLELAPVIAELAPVIAELVPPLGDVLIALLPAVPALGDLLVAVAQLLVPIAQLVGWLIELSAEFQIGPSIEALSFAIGLVTDGIAALAGWLTDTDWAALWDDITGAVSNAWNGITGFFSELPGKAADFLTELPGKLREKATQALEDMAFAVGVGIGKVTRFFIDLPGNLVEFIKELPGKLKESATEAGNSFKDELLAKFTVALDWIKTLPGKIADFIKDIPTKLREKFSEISGQVWQLGRDIVQGVINGITSMVSGIGTALKNGFNSALAGVKHGLGISSPSKVYMEVGEDTIAGYIAGVEQSAKSAAMATTAALAPAAAAPAAVAPAAPAPVALTAGDALMAALLDRMREQIRDTFGGDPGAALATVS